MTLARVQPDRFHPDFECARLEELHRTGILDTEPEPAYDAVTRLVAEHFEADWAGVSFADARRIWVKSYYGQQMRELPRCNSIFDMVLAEDGPVVIPDIVEKPEFDGFVVSLKVLGARFVAAVPVRSGEGKVLGLLIFYRHLPRPALSEDEVRLLEGLAHFISQDLEARRQRHAATAAAHPHSGYAEHFSQGEWPTPRDLRMALANEEFVLHYQPEVDLMTGRIVAVEALIRWQHPERGLIAPGKFIGVAEESRLILPIGDWVLANACSQIAQWCSEDERNREIRVCVNLSAHQFSHVGLTDHINALMLQHRISSHQLGLEVTESSLIANNDISANVLHSLHELGVALLMDDFGTGYSSLNYLHSFPFDVLKLDRSFIERMLQAEPSLQIVRSVLDLARSVDMEVVAEGVETCRQHRVLRELGCRYGQGFLFAKPLPAEVITKMLREDEWLCQRRLPQCVHSETEPGAVPMCSDNHLCRLLVRL